MKPHLLNVIQERWAYLTPDNKPHWVDIIEPTPGLIPREFDYRLSGVPSLDPKALMPRPLEPERSRAPIDKSLEGIRAFILQELGKERVIWYGPVPNDVNWWKLTLDEIKTYPELNPNTLNLAFRLEYKDKSFDALKAIMTSTAFIHDSILMASQPPHEELKEVQVTITFNTPIQGTTKLVVAREGDGWEANELGFNR